MMLGSNFGCCLTFFQLLKITIIENTTYCGAAMKIPHQKYVSKENRFGCNCKEGKDFRDWNGAKFCNFCGSELKNVEIAREWNYCIGEVLGDYHLFTEKYDKGFTYCFCNDGEIIEVNKPFKISKDFIDESILKYKKRYADSINFLSKRFDIEIEVGFFILNDYS